MRKGLIMALKRSRQREMIKSFLMGRKDHLTLLSDMGEILRLRVGDGVDHFDADTSEHYHFVCTECGNVIDLDMDSIDSIMETAGERFDGRIRGHITYFYGTCPACTRVATKS